MAGGVSTVANECARNRLTVLEVSERAAAERIGRETYALASTKDARSLCYRCSTREAGEAAGAGESALGDAAVGVVVLGLYRGLRDLPLRLVRV